MTLRDCIQTKIPDSAIRRRLLNIAGDSDLEAAALVEFGTAKQNLRSIVKTAKVKSKLLVDLADETTPSWKDPSVKVHDPEGNLVNKVSGGGESMELKGEVYIAEFHAKLDAELRKAKVKGIAGKWWGRNDEAWNRNASRAIHGDKVEESALSVFGETFRTMTKEVAERLNTAGGKINVKEDFYLPHVHSVDRIILAKKDKWVADVKKHFDMENLIYEGSEKSIDDVLTHMFNNITDYSGAGAGVGRSFRRRLTPKSGDDWFKYNQLYGEEDVFGTIMKYIDNSGRRIAALETFGPNPRTMVESLTKEMPNLAKSMDSRGVKVRKGGFRANLALDAYDNIMGFQNVGSPGWAKLGQTTRTTMVVTKLGLSPITAITDTAFSAMASSMSKMPIVRTILSQLTEVATAGNRDFLSQLGVISDVVSNDIRAAHRLADLSGNGTAVKVANVYTRVIGLNRWTNSMKVGHAYELLAHMTNMRKTAYSEIDKGVRRLLGEYGIDEGAWSHLQIAGTINNKGAVFIDPAKIADKATRTKFVGMLQQEARYAVPEPNAKARATLNWGRATGTLAGEILRTTTQFKSFPVTVMQMQFGRIKRLPTQRARAFYASNLLAGTTVLGAMSLWIKDLINGRDPQEINSEFVFHAMVQGGATGFAGDVLRDVGEYGGGVADLIGGPSMGLLNVLAQAPRELLDDEQTLKEYAGKMTALGLKQIGQSASYGKLLINRLMLDGLQEDVYPQIRKKRRTQAKKRGRPYYWKPGKSEPSRAPKLPKIEF